MATTGMTRQEMAEAMAVLDQALYVHEQWCTHLYGTLICRLAPDERDLADSPHRRCPFGQWYYAQHGTPLSAHPGFVAIEAEHEKMHQVATHMLTLSRDGLPVPVREYESFTLVMSRMRGEIHDLRHELGDAMSNLDPLTGAPSRVGMLTKLRAQQEVVRRDLQTCVLAMMDLDHFKRVNDEHGHPAGGAGLAATARYVLTHLRPYDGFFRYGGEEFLYWAPGSDLETGLAAVERLRLGVDQLEIPVADGAVVRVTASFGLALLDPEQPVEESIARADKALYAAKAAGRNRSVVWDDSLG